MNTKYRTKDIYPYVHSILGYTIKSYFKNDFVKTEKFSEYIKLNKRNISLTVSRHIGWIQKSHGEEITLELLNSSSERIASLIWPSINYGSLFGGDFMGNLRRPPNPNTPIILNPEFINEYFGANANNTDEKKQDKKTADTSFHSYSGEDIEANANLTAFSIMVASLVFIVFLMTLSGNHTNTQSQVTTSTENSKLSKEDQQQEIYSEKCSSGDMKGCHLLGELQMNQNDIGNAIRSFSKSCDGNYYPSCVRIGEYEEQLEDSKLNKSKDDDPDFTPDEVQNNLLVKKILSIKNPQENYIRKLATGKILKDASNWPL